MSCIADEAEVLDNPRVAFDVLESTSRAVPNGVKHVFHKRCGIRELTMHVSYEIFFSG